MNLLVNFDQESDDRQQEVMVVQRTIPWSTNMASSVWSESMEMWRLSRRTFHSPTTMKRSKVEHFPFNVHTTKHLDSVTEKGTLQPSNSFLTSQHETPLSPPESGSPSSTFAASTSTKNVTENGRHGLSIESNHQFIQILSPDHNSNCSIYAISFLHILGFRNTRHRLIMRISVFTVAYAAIAAVGTNAVDVQGTFWVLVSCLESVVTDQVRRDSWLRGYSRTNN